MIYFIIIAVTLSSILSVLSLGVMDVIYTSQKTLVAQSEKAHLNQVTIALNHSLRRIGENQSVVAPIGQGHYQNNDVDGNPIYLYQTLPESIGASHINKFGLPYVYCPVSSSNIDYTLPLDNVHLSKTEMYSVGTVKNENGISYVAQSDYILDPSIDSDEVIALVVSLLGSEETITCKDIKYSSANNIYSVNNGVVSAITKSSLNKLSYSEEIIVDFADKSSGYTINDAFESWSVMKPKKLTILLPYNPNPYVITDNIDLTNSSAENDMSVIIKYKGDNTSKQTTSISSSGYVLTASGVNLKIENIKLNGSLKVKSSDASVVVDSGRAPEIEVDNGNLVLKNDITITSNVSGASISAYLSQVKLINAELVVTNTNAGYPAISLDSSSMVNRGAASIDITSSNSNNGALALVNSSSFSCDSCSIKSSAAVTVSNDFYIDNTSTLSISNSNLSTAPSTSGISLYGDLVSKQSSISFSSGTNSGIVLRSGARLTLENSTVGFPYTDGSDALPGVGINDLGSSFISGTGTSINASSVCWSGPIFNLKSGATSGNSEAIESTYKIFNQSSWLCNN